MAGKKRAEVADKAGVTRHNQWFAIGGGLELLDLSLIHISMGPKNKFKAIFLIVLAFAVSLMLVFGTIDYIANHRTFESGVIDVYKRQGWHRSF